jgi:hypothetical protein
MEVSDVWLRDPRFLVGLAIFLGGLFGNIQADNTLLRLRRTCKKGEYKIPYGGMFTYVSAANYGTTEFMVSFDYHMTSLYL